MKYIFRYIRFHLIFLYSIYQFFLLKSHGGTFARLFNIKSAIRNIDIRFFYDSTKRRYSASGKKDDRILYFYHEKQADMAYQRGIYERGNSLGKTYFLDKIQFSDDDLVLDCGANIGDLLLWFQNNDITVRYVGFEPSPKEYECLSENVAPHKTFNVGLWNERKTIDFFVSSQSADSSIIEPQDYDEAISVEAVLLSDYVDEKVKLLKLEAEGAEPEILEGLGDKLNLIEYISADLGYERGKNAESTLVPVTNYLLARNFSLVDVSHDRICALYINNNSG